MSVTISKGRMPTIQNAVLQKQSDPCTVLSFLSCHASYVMQNWKAATPLSDTNIQVSITLF
jgi:hypothetical protein